MADRRPRLVLVRHANAGEAARDVDRPLTGRGRSDAAALGRWLAEHDVVPDAVVVSPAARARETWSVAAQELATAGDAMTDPRLYDNTLDAVAAVVRTASSSAQTLVLVGHNPSMSDLAHWLDDGAGDGSARRMVAAGLPTCGVVIVDAVDDWCEIGAGAGTVRAAAAPRSGGLEPEA